MDKVQEIMRKVEKYVHACNQLEINGVGMPAVRSSKAVLEAALRDLVEREPLSDEQIENLLRSWPNDGIAFFDFARAIERAHGIEVK